MNIVFGIIVGLVILMLLVVAHEFGHFIMARKNGVRVLEFGIGFAPRAIAWVKKSVEQKDKRRSAAPRRKRPAHCQRKMGAYSKIGWNKPQDSMIFSLNWLPIGGFCAMDGESDADRRKGTLAQPASGARLKSSSAASL